MSAIRRACGIIALVLFAVFQGEAMMPDQCDDMTRASLLQQDGSPASPVPDGHLLHSCHCLHVHVASRGTTVALATPADRAVAAPNTVLSDPAAPPHLPFRPPLI